MTELTCQENSSDIANGFRPWIRKLAGSGPSLMSTWSAERDELYGVLSAAWGNLQNCSESDPEEQPSELGALASNEHLPNTKRKENV